MKSLVRTCLCALLLTTLSFVSAFAQSDLHSSTSSANRELAEVLDRGRQLEQRHKWAEAVVLYEDAIRANPCDQTLEQRLDCAKMHDDLGRRYGDASFRNCIVTLSETQILDLYAEVLLKIQTHYVVNPDWQAMINRGTRCLDMAVMDPPFAERQLKNVPPEQIDNFRRELAKTINAQQICTRQDALDVVLSIERLAALRLGIPGPATVMEFTAGAAGALDEYSAYLTPDQLQEAYSQIEGKFVGIGVELKAADQALAIVRVIPNSPAERIGIKSGDRITAVDGRSVRELNTNQAAELLLGREGSVVEIVVVSPHEEPRRLLVRREHVDVSSVDDVKIVDRESGIAYLKITYFQKTTSKDLDAALWKLHQDGMRSLIVDLRGNPGGLLTAGVDAADKFIDEGTIVSTRGRSQPEERTYTAHQAGTWQVPLVVLIGGDSASASEIFAGAIRDHHRGPLVGVRSYGKGSVQAIFPLSQTGAGLRLTTAKFYSPNGLSYSKVGVEPDILVRAAAKPAFKYSLTAASGGAAFAGPALRSLSQGELSSNSLSTQPNSPSQEDTILSAGLQAARQQVARK